MSIVCPHCGETIYIEARKATLGEKVIAALGQFNQIVEIQRRRRL